MHRKSLNWGMLVLAAGCAPAVDPALVMLDQVDRRLPEDRPDNWEITRSLMLRLSPVVGLN